MSRNIRVLQRGLETRSRVCVTDLDSLMSLVKAGLHVAMATAVRMCASLIAVKVIANELGASGLGYLGQFMSVMAVFTTIAGGGISTAITKHVAELKGEPSVLLPYLKAGYVIWLIFSALVFISLMLLSRQASVLVFGDDDYYLVFCGLAVLQLFIGASNILLALIVGQGSVAGYSNALILTALAGLAATVSLTISFGVTGAMWGLVLAPAIGVVFAAWAATPYASAYRGFSQAVTRSSHFKALLKFTVMLLVTAATIPVAQLLVRSWLSDSHGWEEVGHWQGMLKISDAYLQFVTMILTSYYLPKLSAIASDNRQLRLMVQNALLFALASLPICLAVIWYLRQVVIRVLYSEQFLVMENLFLPQLWGDLFRMLSYVITFIAVSKAQTLLYVAGELFQATVFLLFAWQLAPRNGALGVSEAHALTYTLYFLVSLAVYWRLVLKAPDQEAA